MENEEAVIGIKPYLGAHELGNVVLEVKMHVDGSVETSRATTPASIIVQGLHCLGLDAELLTHTQEIVRSNVQNGVTHTFDVQIVAINTFYSLQKKRIEREYLRNKCCIIIMNLQA